MSKEPAYEYRGLLASSWDLLRGDTSDWPDRPFYREIIEEGGEPALDVGCGTGRLLLDYLAAGLDVDGVDTSPEMLALCREKAQAQGLSPRLYEQHMERLDIPRKYRTIFVPSSSFQLVTDPPDAMEALSRLHRHLEPAGMLVMSIMDIASDRPFEWRLVGEQVRPDDNLTVRRWERSRYDTATELEHTENRYELVRAGKVVATELHRRSPATRNYSLAQITEMMVEAGFGDVRAVSGFTHQPARTSDDVFCVFGTRRT